MRQHSLEAFVSKAEGLGVEPATRQWNRERLDATEEFCAEAGERAHGALDLDSILDEDAEHVQAFLEDSVVSLNGLRYQFPSHAACASGELYEPPTFECLPRSLLWGDIYLPELSQAYKVQRTLSPDPEDRGALLEWTPEGCHCAWWDVGCSLVSNHGACVKMLRDASRNGRIVITVLLVFVSAIGVCLSKHGYRSTQC
ncbi:MAG: uncharacterized protein KVP18_000406 [Porospora cf. gigantea A]|uniref:uncharacterized protein n=1 Tax=Porospora cf. gigantea A TaxID=2853593 RepID=UPI00355A1603|nr:MAG: hypothetical protein KVP18_000406 [Porospora cf. gigantea A]